MGCGASSSAGAATPAPSRASAPAAAEKTHSAAQHKPIEGQKPGTAAPPSQPRQQTATIPQDGEAKQQQPQVVKQQSLDAVKPTAVESVTPGSRRLEPLNNAPAHNGAAGNSASHASPRALDSQPHSTAKAHQSPAWSSEITEATDLERRSHADQHARQGRDGRQAHTTPSQGYDSRQPEDTPTQHSSRSRYEDVSQAPPTVTPLKAPLPPPWSSTAASSGTAGYISRAGTTSLSGGGGGGASVNGQERTSQAGQGAADAFVSTAEHQASYGTPPAGIQQREPSQAGHVPPGSRSQPQLDPGPVTEPPASKAAAGTSAAGDQNKADDSHAGAGVELGQLGAGGHASMLSDVADLDPALVYAAEQLDDVEEADHHEALHDYGGDDTTGPSGGGERASQSKLAQGHGFDEEDDWGLEAPPVEDGPQGKEEEEDDVL